MTTQPRTAPSGQPGAVAADASALRDRSQQTRDPRAQDELTWPDLTATLLTGDHLTASDTSWAMNEVMQGRATPVQLAGFLMALRAKGESTEEMSGLADAMLANAVRIDVDADAVDIVGTGGDRQSTVNVSTMAGMVCAGAGVRVLKHGNRASSSKSGTADVLEQLGVRLDLTPEQVAQVADEVGITLLFAQVFHPAMRHAAVARRELALPSAFNLLGPLTNPAQPRVSAIGVADAAAAPLVAGVFAARLRRAMVFRGEDGLDEFTTTGPSRLWWVNDGHVAEFTVNPLELGVPRATMDQLRGGDAAHNAQVCRDVLTGQPGPVRDLVTLNAAVALLAADGFDGTHDGLVAGLAAGLDRARASIDSGSAAGVLQRWIDATQAIAGGNEPATS